MLGAKESGALGQGMSKVTTPHHFRPMAHPRSFILHIPPASSTADALIRTHTLLSGDVADPDMLPGRLRLAQLLRRGRRRARRREDLQGIERSRSE